MSVMESISNLICSVFKFLHQRLERRDSRNDAIVGEFNDMRDGLKNSLSDGRIQDASYLSRRIHEFYERHSSVIDKYCIFLFVLCLLSGCKTTSDKASYTPTVIGERIIIVDPGSTITVPNYISPARKWYLVDDVGLMHWLGLDIGEWK